MRLSNDLRSVLIIRISTLIDAISSVFLPVISKMPSTLSDSLSTLSVNMSTLSINTSTFSVNPSTLSRRADRPSPNILKSECRDSKTTVNSLSLFRSGFLFFNLGSSIFFKSTTIDVGCQGKMGSQNSD